MGDMSGTNEQALARAIKARRLELGYEHTDVVRLAGKGLSIANLSKLENARPGPYRQTTYAAVDRALGWANGTAEAMATGTGTRSVLAPDTLDRILSLEEQVMDLREEMAEIITLLGGVRSAEGRPVAPEVRPSDTER